MEDVRCKRRSWSDAEKRQIVKETYAAGVSVSEVARRHDVNANLLFTWRRDPRFCGEPPTACFLPVELDQSLSLGLGCTPSERPFAEEDPDRLAPPGTELHLEGGVRLRFGNAVDEACLIRLVTALRRAS